MKTTPFLFICQRMADVSGGSIVVGRLLDSASFRKPLGSDGARGGDARLTKPRPHSSCFRPPPTSLPA